MEVDTFKAYLVWVYREQVATYRIMPPPGYNFGDDNQAIGAVADLVKLWLLGDQLMDTRICNAVMDGLLYVANSLLPWTGVETTDCFTPQLITLVWQNTREDARLCQLLLDLYASSVASSYVKEHRSEFEAEFMGDLCFQLLDSYSDYGGCESVDPDVQPACDYHKHNEQHPECVTDATPTKKRKLTT